MRHRKTLVAGLAAALACSSLLLAGDKNKAKAAADSTQMDAHRRALHALNRLTFGPRPGDVERVQAAGAENWIEQQLHPEKIDDSRLEARLAPFRTLKMDARQMAEAYPPPQVIRAVAEGRLPLPRDPEKRAVYEAQIARYRQRQERKADQGDSQPGMMEEDDRARGRAKRREAAENAESILSLPPEERMKAILTMDPEERRRLARSLPPEQRQELLGSLSPQQRESLMAMANPQQVVITELAQAKVLRAAYSERQLEEVLTDFWFNHFNVFIGKGADRYLVTSYERDVIRPRVLGKFKDLLIATAKSPAMLFYLDNWQSVGPNSPFAKGEPRREFRGRRFGLGGRPGFGRMPRGTQEQARAQRQRRGLNENYARELMELHTLGVDGGYTQKDVTEVARVFTGWTLREPRRGGGFDFNERMHEPGSKTVLGRKIADGGEKEGMQVLEMLARHPSTARFISTRLAQRFVSDTPPRALVDRMAQTFLKTDGDIREVLRTMFHSREFWAADAYRAKVKTPLEFVASAIRASGAEVSDAMPFVQALNRMGMPLYGAQPPTGYSTQASDWVNSAALLNRMNFALAFASGRIPGAHLDTAGVLGPEPPQDADQALARLENALLAGDVSAQTHETIKGQLVDPQVTQAVLDDRPRGPNVGVIAGLILGSPEFQRR